MGANVETDRFQKKGTMKQETIHWHTVEEKEPGQNEYIMIRTETRNAHNSDEILMEICLFSKSAGGQHYWLTAQGYDFPAHPTDLWAEVRGPQT